MKYTRGITFMISPVPCYSVAEISAAVVFEEVVALSDKPVFCLKKTGISFYAMSL